MVRISFLAFLSGILITGTAVGARRCPSTGWENILTVQQSRSIRDAAIRLNMPEATIDKLLSRVPSERLDELNHLFMGLSASNGALTKEDYLRVTRFLKKYGAQDLFRFHTTRQGTLDKIAGEGVMRPGAAEWAIYALDSPANLSALGALRAVSLKSSGKDTVIFQGEAANLFKPHPRNGIAGMLKYANGEKVVGDAQLVIDEYRRVDGETLVITKAHLIPLTPQQAASARFSKLFFHIPDAVVVGALAAGASSLASQIFFAVPDEEDDPEPKGGPVGNKN